MALTLMILAIPWPNTAQMAQHLRERWTDIGAADTFEELGAAAIYKTSVVLWRMLFQRLNPKASLKDAVLCL